MNTGKLMTASKSAAVGAVMSMVLTAGAVQAAPMLYTDRMAFDLAVSGAGLTPSTIDFDGVAAGTTIADGGTFSGVTFNYPVLAGLGVGLEVRDDFDTTSGNNFLGTDTGGLLDNDDFNLSFGAASAIGMFFITSDPAFADDIRITVGGFTASSSGATVDVLADGGLVYFIGIVDDMGGTFTSADIVTSQFAPDVFFDYTVDDIIIARGGVTAIPEPGSLAILGLGLVGFGIARRRQMI